MNMHVYTQLYLSVRNGILGKKKKEKVFIEKAVTS